MDSNILTGEILKCAFRVHGFLGPGLLENAYESCLCYEFNRHGIFFEHQKILPLQYFDVKLEAGYRLDILVENKVIIEVKSVESLSNIHIAQVLTYLKLSGCKIALLINFNEVSLKTGIRRLVH